MSHYADRRIAHTILRLNLPLSSEHFLPLYRREFLPERRNYLYKVTGVNACIDCSKFKIIRNFARKVYLWNPYNSYSR